MFLKIPISKSLLALDSPSVHSSGKETGSNDMLKLFRPRALRKSTPHKLNIHVNSGRCSRNVNPMIVAS